MTQHITSSVYAKHPPPINLIVRTKLAFYNSKNSKLNRSASPFRRKDLTTFKSSHLASSMAQSSARCSPCQNLHNGKDELAGKTPTKSNNRCTPAPAAIYASTPAVALVVAPLVASSSANSSVVGYLKDDLQQIFRTVLDFKPLAPVPALVVAAAPHYESPRERPLKAWFPDIYWDKTHLKCYNFFQ